MKILVAEDCPISRAIIQKTLAAWDGEVEIVNDGLSAMAVLRQATAPMLALIDGSMPGLTGTEICQQLTGLDPRPPVYVVLLSANGDKADVIAGLDAGADDYIAKPFESGKLFARLRAGCRSLERWRGAAAGTRPDPEMPGAASQPAAAALPAATPIPAPRAAANVRIASSTLTQEFAALTPFINARRILVDTFAALKIGHTESIPAVTFFGEKEPAFAMWQPILVPTGAVWIDALIETDRKSASVFFEWTTGLREGFTKDFLDALREAMNLVGQRLKSAFEAEGGEALTPSAPRPVKAGNLAGIHASGKEHIRTIISIHGVPLCITLFPHRSPIVRKGIENVGIRDVSTEAVPSPAGGRAILLKQGVMFDEPALRQLQQAAVSESRPFAVNVLEPSPLVASLSAA